MRAFAAVAAIVAASIIVARRVASHRVYRAKVRRRLAEVRGEIMVGHDPLPGPGWVYPVLPYPRPVNGQAEVRAS